MAKQPNHLTEDQILKYSPLVTNISLYFFRLNKDKNLDWEDVYQTAWLGFLKGCQKWQDDRGVTLGAYARSWAWGQVYRSILGSRAVSNRKLQIGYPTNNVIEKVNYEDEYDLYDFIESLIEPDRTVIRLSSQGYKIKEIVEITQLNSSQIHEIHVNFEIKLMNI